MTGELFGTLDDRVPIDILIDYGHLEPDQTVPNNVTWYPYAKGSECSHRVSFPATVVGSPPEATISCPLCAMEHNYSLLRRVFENPSMPPVWHEHYNHTTNAIESDRRGMDRHLKQMSEEATARNGIAHNFVRTDPAEMRALVTDTKKQDEMSEALVATHNQRVKEGKKESKGRFTF